MFGLLRRLFWQLLQLGLVPDFLIRWRIRLGLKQELSARGRGGVEKSQDALEAFVAQLKSMPIAVHQQDANQQHYEVPSEFFQIVLGSRLKYSSCLWSSGAKSLAEAEDHMLDLTCKRADVQNGQTVLDLGCGWGSLALFVAERFPACSVVAVSNSSTQRDFIQRHAKDKGFNNVRVITADVAVFDSQEFEDKFDRIMSIEMFEHMKNYELLLKKLSTWLKPEGKLFVHIFTHVRFAYHFDKGWMSRTFFSGGCMPSHDLLLHFQKHLRIQNRWAINGENYSKTLDAWLKKFDNNFRAIKPILEKTYGPTNLARWSMNWRMFFLVCSESFGFNGGSDYIVSHYLFSK